MMPIFFLNVALYVMLLLGSFRKIMACNLGFQSPSSTSAINNIQNNSMVSQLNDVLCKINDFTHSCFLVLWCSCSHVYMCLALCNITTHVGMSAHHHSQDIKQPVSTELLSRAFSNSPTLL